MLKNLLDCIDFFWRVRYLPYKLLIKLVQWVIQKIFPDEPRPIERFPKDTNGAPLVQSALKRDRPPARPQATMGQRMENARRPADDGAHRDEIPPNPRGRRQP